MLKQFRSNSYLFGGNAPYIEDLYESYLDNPGSVPEQWRTYFDQMQLVAGAGKGAEDRDVAHAPIIESFAMRAKLMRETCYEVLGALGLEKDPLFKLAMALEKVALEDDYFVKRKLYPNVDYYSGIVQKALGIPVSMFTGIFSLARTVGWIAQWQEMITDPEYKIGRPRQLYNGPTRRDIKPIDKR